MSTKVNVKDIQDAVSDLATIHITQIPKVVLDANVYELAILILSELNLYQMR